MDADRKTASLEQGQACEHARDRPAGDRDELVDGVPSEHELAPESARSLADIRECRRCLRVDSGFGQVVGQTEVVDELWDAGHDPCRVPELAEEGETAGRRRRIDRAGDEVAVTSLLECPGGCDQRSAASRCLDHDRRIGQAADDPVAPRERALASATTSGPSSETMAPPDGDDPAGQRHVGARDGRSHGPTR